MYLNFWAVLISAILSMIIGYIWYGPIFGKKWMEVNGIILLDPEARKKMRQRSAGLYLVQFFLALLEVYILAYLMNITGAFGMGYAILVWLGFVIPTVAAGVMWNPDPGKIKWARFLIQAGYQLVIFIIFGLLIGTWR